jgi:hypothetical protein
VWAADYLDFRIVGWDRKRILFLAFVQHKIFKKYYLKQVRLFERECPEFSLIVDEFDVRMRQVGQVYQPLVDLMQQVWILLNFQLLLLT